MSLLPESREEVEIEDVQYRSSVSEALATKLGQNLNFVFRRVNKAWDYSFNGIFKPLTFPEDGSRGEIFNYEIVGVSGILHDSGISGTTEFDLRLYQNGIDQGSILSTTLQITGNGNAAQFYKNLVNATDASTGNVAALPIFSQTTFGPTDRIAGKLVSNGNTAEQFVVNLHYRTIN